MYYGKMQAILPRQYSECAVEKIFEEREDFLVIALTGRIGSGCTSASEIFSREAKDLNLPHVSPEPKTKDKSFRNQQRQERIIENFAKAGHWKPFDVIKVRDILTSFVLESLEALEPLVKSLNENAEEVNGIKQEIIKRYDEWMRSEEASEVKKYFDNYAFEEMIALNAKFWEIMEINHHISQNGTITNRHFCLITVVIPKISQIIREILLEIDSFLYTKTYQSVGNIVRTYGRFTMSAEQTEPDANAIFSVAKRINYVIKLYRKKEWLILDDEKQKSCSIHSSSVRIVIDSIKNLFEATYLRDRYSAFYMLAISVDENKRQEYLRDKEFERDKSCLRMIDYCERPSAARKAYKEYTKNINQYCGQEDAELERFFHSISENRFPFSIWKKAYEQGTYTFNLQDVEACIQNADIFINNDKSIGELTKIIVRYVCLMMHPGLVQPTDDERCMQIAQTAKLNSGCISRQVGAVVCNSASDIVSIGWNRPAANSNSEVVPCNYRNFVDCYELNDQMAYSDLERENKKFRAYLESNFCETNRYVDVMKEYRQKLRGIPMAYCFKDLYCDMMKDHNQVHTRSLHAEEMALQNSSREQTEGGSLYTTSCSCELCAKKALYYGIRRIIYVEPYQGITEDHVLGFPDGENPEEKQVKVELFTGACHRAYTQLYSPIFPLKDELEMRGVSFTPKEEIAGIVEQQECPYCNGAD